MASCLPISLCMIAKNEEVFIGTALKSANAVLQPDDMVVVDTGSMDKTKKIALENGARVFDFKWCDDFSAARNFAADKAKYDWILILDADDEVVEADTGMLKNFIQNDQAVGMVETFDLVDKIKRRGAQVYNRRIYSYEGRIHEQLRPLDGSSPLIAVNLNISTVHHGYLPEFNKVMGKLVRNSQILERELIKRPDDPYLLYQLGKSYFCNDRDIYKACEYFEKALSAGADVNVKYTYNLIECYGYTLIDTGQYEKALKLRDTFAPHFSNNTQFRFLSAHIYQNNGMLQEAVESYESCIGADTDDQKGINSFLSYYNIGVILECVGMIEDAVQMYKNCGDYEPARLRLNELVQQ